MRAGIAQQVAELYLTQSYPVVPVLWRERAKAEVELRRGT